MEVKRKIPIYRYRCIYYKLLNFKKNKYGIRIFIKVNFKLFIFI